MRCVREEQMPRGLFSPVNPGCVSLVRWDGSGMTKSWQDFSEEAGKFGAQSPHLDPQV